MSGIAVVAGAGLTFLEARRVLSGFEGGETLPILLAMSGNPMQLEMFVRAAAARQGRAAVVRTLPFNTLRQALMTAPVSEEREVFLMFPWDFVPELDWRSGFPTELSPDQDLRQRAEAVALSVANRPRARMLYVAAPVPPLFSDPRRLAALEHWLSALASSNGAVLLEAAAFSLSGYLGSGSPISSAWQGSVAELMVARLQAEEPSRKVLVTDLDNVAWAGGVAEEGVEGIEFGPEGKGYQHFVYQGFLEKLRKEGVLLAAVSRNDPDVAVAPFRSGRMILREESMVAILASYGAKSAQIRELSRSLSLPLESFVFVDDSDTELAEVSAAVPAVCCLRFPRSEDELPKLLARIQGLFARTSVVAEDTERTELYRRRAAAAAPQDLAGADLTEFLRTLEMTLTVHDRSVGDRTRAMQLLNKTNQFNLNGRRVDNVEVDAIVAGGGRLLGASLADRSGSHGEIIYCMIDGEGTVRSFVMSCRVFQRRVEHVFFLWLCDQQVVPRLLAYAGTARNEPIRQFLSDSAFSPLEDGLVRCDVDAFRAAHGAAVALFDVKAG